MESRRSLHWTIALLSFVCASDALDSAVNGGIYPWFVYALMTFIFLAAMVWHGIAAEREKNVKEYKPTTTVGDYTHEAAS